ncbi:MAG: DUF4157 domain-containing protein [Limnoraphis robusta]
MTHQFKSPQKNQSSSSSASVPASRYANRDFAEPVKQKREQPDLQTILQRKTQISHPISTKVAQKQEESAPNKTGLPDHLKAGIENLSGYSLDNVRVHYNSSKPAQLQALAYAQGTEIHVAPGQEKHLPHEAWHVVQQMQGRVKPTMQMKGVQINDDGGLEKEAEVMSQALNNFNTEDQRKTTSVLFPKTKIFQRQVPRYGTETSKPIPETGSYKARGGQNEIFNKGIHLRKFFSFGSKTRLEVLSKSNLQKVGNLPVTARTGIGVQMNVEGIQLDHEYSWDNITNAMQNNNANSNRTFDYTLWDAKMYYNDQSNLIPQPAGVNAAAGAQGVRRIQEIHAYIAEEIGRVSRAWLNYQAGITAIAQGDLDEETKIKLVEQLFQIRQQMERTTDLLF